MKSLKHQIIILVIILILVLTASFMLFFVWKTRETAMDLAESKAKSDIATAEAIMDLKYPGPWRQENDLLYKGNVKMNDNFDIVDYISKLTGDTCTIFMGTTRISTTVVNDKGQRAVGTHSSDVVANKVLSDGKVYFGEADVVGEKYQTVYKPIYDQFGNIIGMFYVGISNQYIFNKLSATYKSMIIIGVFFALLVLIISLYFAQRVIIHPIKLITAGTQKIALGDWSEPVNIGESCNEIGELAKSFNQLKDQMEALTSNLGKLTEVPIVQGTFVNDNNSNLDRLNAGKNNLTSKGISEATLEQITDLLKSKSSSLSVSEIAQEIKLTTVTVRRYLDYMEKCGEVSVETKYGPIGRPLKLYRLLKESE